LFGNAGILGPLSPLVHLHHKAWDEIMAVNVTVNWRLIRALDPVLRKSEAGRVLMASSAVARLNRPYWGGYAISKAALEMLTFTYAAELNGTKVKVNALNPGPTRTRMRAEAMPGEDPMTLPAPEELTPLILEMLSPACEKTGELVTFRRSGN
jgi:NAD(P)-dependent dehydrogenase (short-subunit alcohol dehydrogenase family)